APEYQDDGGWRYSYAQEESKRGDATSLFTNQGLKKCMDDGVPVAVLVQLSKKPNVTRYRLLGLAKVVAWENKVFTLESTTLTEALIRTNQKLDDSLPYSPAGIEDSRKRILREITERQGQGAFRSGLLTAYEGRCTITDCKVTQVLEAAHITPYLGPKTNNISNGLLLRSDLHTLWDKGLIYLCDHFTLQLKSSLLNSEYSS
ncbi:HNH endonuclease, partial [Pseudomonas qingdaonensis]|uniref:HNH endonuclease n=1 Tax=Pseudomonas qingdaonensis TaxID=2056231 RepID=UPI0035139C54